MKSFLKFKPDCCPNLEFSVAALAIAHEKDCRLNRRCSTCRLVCRRFDKLTGEEVHGIKSEKTGCGFWQYTETQPTEAKRNHK